jgi:hypothetical protein
MIWHSAVWPKMPDAHFFSAYSISNQRMTEDNIHKQAMWTDEESYVLTLYPDIDLFCYRGVNSWDCLWYDLTSSLLFCKL